MTGGMQDRWDAGQVGCGTGGMRDRRMQDRRNEEQVRFMTGRMQDRWDAEQVECRTGGMQDKWDEDR